MRVRGGERVSGHPSLKNPLLERRGVEGAEAKPLAVTLSRRVPPGVAAPLVVPPACASSRICPCSGRRQNKMRSPCTQTDNISSEIIHYLLQNRVSTPHAHESDPNVTVTNGLTDGAHQFTRCGRWQAQHRQQQVNAAEGRYHRLHLSRRDERAELWRAIGTTATGHQVRWKGGPEQGGHLLPCGGARLEQADDGVQHILQHSFILHLRQQ
jgi:hypothetical protein